MGSRVGGIPELVEDGLNGYLFAPEDVRGLIVALNCALRDQVRLRDYISKRRKAYRDRFSWKRTAGIVAENLRLAGGEHGKTAVHPNP